LKREFCYKLFEKGVLLFEKGVLRFEKGIAYCRNGTSVMHRDERHTHYM
jgi:hypothetical protein